jgi:hypothetical protein
MKKELPIIMQAGMVLATIDGRKTKTRRTRGLQKVNEDPDNIEWLGMQEYPDGSVRAIFQHIDDEPGSVRCPYGKPGDWLYVRESGWLDNNYMPGLNQAFVIWRTDEDKKDTNQQFLIKEHMQSFPAIHMYKELARIWLEVEEIRVERLHDITNTEAREEGIDLPKGFEPKRCFEELWNFINGKKMPWEKNPWVWVISFKVLSTTGKPMETSYK